VNDQERENAQDLLLALRVKQVLGMFTPLGGEDRALHDRAKVKADASLKEAMATYVGGSGGE
jgi:hypothetical protein